jgi:hypothetical protein
MAEEEKSGRKKVECGKGRCEMGNAMVSRRGAGARRGALRRGLMAENGPEADVSHGGTGSTAVERTMGGES